ncbi:hypothetical protein C8R44DRAFT_434482 [Mycena epipterygia]|nr:hypothetical protein C8R44DRAFT_434482 [Mycena epipterygia]
MHFHGGLCDQRVAFLFRSSATRCSTAHFQMTLHALETTNASIFAACGPSSQQLQCLHEARLSEQFVEQCNTQEAVSSSRSHSQVIHRQKKMNTIVSHKHMISLRLRLRGYGYPSPDSRAPPDSSRRLRHMIVAGDPARSRGRRDGDDRSWISACFRQSVRSGKGGGTEKTGGAKFKRAQQLHRAGQAKIPRSSIFTVRALVPGIGIGTP